MKKRYLYAVLWGVPGLFVAWIVTTLILGMLLGVLWLFVFGDNAWPFSVGPVLTLLAIITFLSVWIGLIVVGYRLGKRLENQPGIDRRHILLSAGLTLVLIVCILFQQFAAGNLGPRTDSLLCSDYCVQRGYSGSGMPPADSGERTCSCYDETGNEAIRIPLENIDSETLK